MKELISSRIRSTFVAGRLSWALVGRSIEEKKSSLLIILVPLVKNALCHLFLVLSIPLLDSSCDGTLCSQFFTTCLTRLPVWMIIAQQSSDFLSAGSVFCCNHFNYQVKSQVRVISNHFNVGEI